MSYGIKHNPGFVPSQLVGKQAPTMRGAYANGEVFPSEILRRSDWKIIHFWTSSCEVCRLEASEMEKFYRWTREKSKGLEHVVYVSVNIQDDAETIEEWKRNFAQTFPILMDKKGLVSLDYGVTGTPEMFFVDPQGVVRYRIAGQMNARLMMTFVNWLNQHPNAQETEISKAFFSF